MLRKSCAIVGYAPDELPFGYNEDHEDCDLLKQRMIKEIVRLCYEGYKTFYTDAEIGVGLWSAEIVLSLRIDFDDLELICVIPHKGRELKWSREFQERYEHIIDNCSEKIIMDESPSLTSTKENTHYLIDRCDMLLAVYKENDISCRTGEAVSHAELSGKHITIIAIDASC